jgi:hypothetical protein
VCFSVFKDGQRLDCFYLKVGEQMLIDGDFKFYPKYYTEEYQPGTLKIIRRDAFGNIIYNENDKKQTR